MSHSSSKSNGENSSSPPPPSPPLLDPQSSQGNNQNNEEITSLPPLPSPSPPSPLLDPHSVSEGNNQNNEEENISTPTPTPTPIPSPLLDPQSSEGQNQVDVDDINSSSSDSAVVAPPPNPAEPVENHEDRGELQELEIYGCKYCNKKFSNKQALGGHQNAHKSERQLEKKALEVRETAFEYYGSGPGGPSSHPQVSLAPNAFPVNVNSFNRSHHEVLLNRPMPMYRHMPYQTQRPPMHIGNYVARPMVGAAVTVPNYPHRPMVPGLNPVYVWNGPAPTVPRFVDPSNWPIQYQTMNPHQFAIPVMNAPRFMPPGINQVGGPNNNQVNGGEQVQENEDSDIDLTLRL